MLRAAANTMAAAGSALVLAVIRVRQIKALNWLVIGDVQLFHSTPLRGAIVHHLLRAGAFPRDHRQLRRDATCNTGAASHGCVHCCAASRCAVWPNHTL